MNLKEIDFLKNKFLNEMAKLHSFTEEEFAVMQNDNVFRVYKKGEMLLKKGQYFQTIFYLIKGCVNSYDLIDGEVRVINFYKENDSFIPNSLWRNTPSTHYLACLEDCFVCVSSPLLKEFKLKKTPCFEKWYRILAEQSLAKMQVEYVDFKMTTAEKRYLKLIAEKPDLLQRIPQYLIASYLGIKPQSLSRIRKRILKRNSYKAMNSSICNSKV